MSAEAVLFPDPLTLATVELRADYLAAGIDAEVHASVLDPLPDVWCQVQLVGGTRRDAAVATARVAFVAWHAESDIDAAELASVTRALVGRWSSTVPEVQRVAEESGPVPLPDPTTGTPRYSFTAALDLRHSGVIPA